MKWWERSILREREGETAMDEFQNEKRKMKIQMKRHMSDWSHQGTNRTGVIEIKHEEQKRRKARGGGELNDVWSGGKWDFGMRKEELNDRKVRGRQFWTPCIKTFLLLPVSSIEWGFLFKIQAYYSLIQPACLRGSSVPDLNPTFLAGDRWTNSQSWSLISKLETLRQLKGSWCLQLHIHIHQLYKKNKDLLQVWEKKLDCCRKMLPFAELL